MNWYEKVGAAVVVFVIAIVAVSVFSGEPLARVAISESATHDSDSQLAQECRELRTQIDAMRDTQDLAIRYSADLIKAVEALRTELVEQRQLQRTRENLESIRQSLARLKRADANERTEAPAPDDGPPSLWDPDPGPATARLLGSHRLGAMRWSTQHQY